MSLSIFRTRSRSTLIAVCTLIIAPLLASCAAQKTFDEGKDLAQQGQTEAALQKMQDASKLDPQQIEFKTTYYRTRDNAIQGYLEEADRDIAAGRNTDAADLFHRVLAMDVANVRAIDGLKHIEIEERHEKLVTEADQLLRSGDYDGARRKLAVVLTENPSNDQALELQRQIIEKTAKSKSDGSLAAIYKKPITLQFSDASIRQIFEIISQSSGLNFIFDKDVKTDQKTSIFLKNSTVEAAVYYTLLTNQLEQQVMNGNTILIYPNTVAKQKDYQAMVVKSFYLTNADAKNVAATLKSIIKAKDVVVDEKLNMLIMRDTPEAIRLAEKLIALHDIAEPEVMLDVAVLEVKRTKLQDLGIQWPNGLTLTPVAPATTLSSATNIPAGALTLNQLFHIPAGNVSVGNPSAQINAHSTDTDANLLANPRIRTRNHEKAKIMIGDRVPNITVNTAPSATTFISETINYVDVGLKLEVEPTVYLDNEVAIKISLEVSNIVSQLVTKSGSIAYQIGTRNASSVLRLKDGETQILAGLLDDEERHTINKIPSLGDIPILGHLFGSTNDDIQKTEIVLSITPHLIRNIRRPDVTAAEFNSGTENNLRERPDSEAGVSVPPSSGGVSRMERFKPVKPTARQINPTDDASVTVAAPAAVPAPETAPATSNTAPVGSGLDLSWVGPSSTQVGAVFSVRINARSDEPLASLPMTLSFDSSALEVVKVDEGDFLRQGGAQSNFNSNVDPTGQIVITGASIGASGSMSGTLAAITFRSLTTGSSTIQVMAASPVSTSGHSVETKSMPSLNVKVDK